MIISLEFPDETIDLQVELVDNPAIHSWADHFLSRPFEVRSHVITNTTPHKFDETKVSELYSKCVSNMNRIGELGHTFEGHMPGTIKDLTRDWCNQAHRFFTHTQKFVNTMSRPELSLEEYTEVQRTLTDRLQELNDDIHLIEDYLAPLPAAPIDFSADEIYCSDFPTYDAPGWWQIEPEWRSYHTAEHATVIFGPQILGKAVLRSYLDGDNPNDWDTTGHYCNGGALLIQVSDFRNRVYTSEPFQSWLQQHGVESPTYDFPVGTIADLAMVNRVYEKLKNTRGPVKTIYKK
jgi:hypothetical protein